MSSDSKSSIRTCSICPSNTYQASEAHRKTACDVTPTTATATTKATTTTTSSTSTAATTSTSSTSTAATTTTAATKIPAETASPAEDNNTDDPAGNPPQSSGGGGGCSVGQVDPADCDALTEKNCGTIRGLHQSSAYYDADPVPSEATVAARDGLRPAVGEVFYDAFGGGADSATHASSPSAPHSTGAIYAVSAKQSARTAAVADGEGNSNEMNC
eukprot:gene15394-9833_t